MEGEGSLVWFGPREVEGRENMSNILLTLISISEGDGG